jgi:hypothetical protein
MNKTADPATPFCEAYQAFFADLATEGTKPNHHRPLPIRHRAVRAVARRGHPVTLAAMERTIPFAYRRCLERLPSSRAARSAAVAAG